MAADDASLARPARTRRELREAGARARAAADSPADDARRVLDAAQHLPAAGAVPHPPTRPGWHCERCDAPWPCDVAREQLAAQYGTDRVGLSIHMGGRLSHAAGELPHTPAGELFERFVAWTR